MGGSFKVSSHFFNMTIPELIQTLRTIDMRIIVDEILIDLSTFIEDLQRDQLESGINPLGRKFGDTRPYSWPWYAEMKQKQNVAPGFGNPDLILTGAFADGIKATVKDRFIEIQSTDFKNDALEAKYKPIFGLIEHNQERLIEFVYQELRIELLKRLKIAA